MTTIRLDTLDTVFTILASAAGFAAFMFAVLRYIIRAETRELRPNGGGSIKDAIHRIDEAAAATNTKLDAHIADATQRVERGERVEAELRRALTDMAHALPTIAASTPAAETPDA